MTYRFELHLAREAADSFRFEARVYDSSNVLIAQSGDFASIDGGGQSLATMGTSPFVNASNLNGLNFGHNGLFFDLMQNTRMYYQGAVAVRTADWCGPYNGAY